MPSTFLSVSARIQIPTSEFQFTFVRSSGPGGQNVNKVNSKAVLRWPLTASPSLPPDVRDRFLTRYGSRLTSAGELIISSQRFRDQGRNVDDCLEKLAAMLGEVARAPRRRRPTKPSKSAVQQRLTAKQAHSRKKHRRRVLPEE